MNSILPPSRYRASSPYSKKPAPGPDSQAPVKTTLMRRYEMLYLDHDSVPAARAAIAPATSLFESAFSAFARGTLIKTVQGTCAIEDLEPGTLIETEEFGPQPMVWRGMMNIIPNALVDGAEQAQLTRVMAGTFGMGRPTTDLVLGPAARMPRRDGIGNLTPLSQFADGDTVFQTSPPSPVQVFHLCLPVQATIRANDLPLVSYHPQPGLSALLGPQMMRLFLSLFPHIDTLLDFGPALLGGKVQTMHTLERALI